MRLISSGIDRSKDRNPASTCAIIGREPVESNEILEGTKAQPIVEFTSPTTTTTSGFSAKTTPSNFFIISAVCAACDPEPTPKSTSDSGRFTSLKKDPDI